MLFSIFSQSEEPIKNPERLKREAARHFSLELQITSSNTGDLEFRVARNAEPWATLRMRAATATDHRQAHDAERRNDAAGMGGLAQRCPFLLELRRAEAAPEALGYQLAACIAFVALGPILPEDQSGLLGVRSAMKAAERLKA
jgi:hypothetical protein